VIRNTASSATLQQNTVIQTGGSFENIRNTDIGVNIESVRLDSKDVMVISGNYNRIGVIGSSTPSLFLM
jgi:hypothetical protein